MKIDQEELNNILKYSLDKVEESMVGKFIPESANRFFMSMAGFECSRIRYFQITNPKPFDLNVRKILYRGEMFHQKIETMFKSYYSLKFKNDTSKQVFTEWDGKFKFEKQYHDFILSGKPDIVMQYDNIFNPIEIKSSNTTYKNYFPNPEHITQINLYLDSLNAETGYLIYVGFNLDFIPFEIQKDEELIKNTIEKHKLLSEAIKNKIIPNKFENWKCKTCNYKQECEVI